MTEELIVTEGAARIDAELLPHRLSIETQSKFFTAAGGYIGVRLDGKEIDECVEYHVERDDGRGWVRVGTRRMGKLVRSNVKGEHYATVTLHGKVEPYWRQPPSRQIRRQLARIGR